MKKISEIPDNLLKPIYAFAEKAYPNECCGMILGPAGKSSEKLRLLPLENIQDKMHAAEPEQFPRTARTAFFISPADLFAIHKEIRKTKEIIRVIYHSHIDTGAYFSEEDLRIAAPEGEPAYPGVDYLVLSVRQGKVQDINLYRWDTHAKKYLPQNEAFY